MAGGSRHTAPILVRSGEIVTTLKRSNARDEAFVQRLVYEHPDVIPINDIEPAYFPLISICRELPTEAGYVDNLWLTPSGAIVLGECKLVRNPQARREVIAQALDYARAISGWHYDDLQSATRRALNSPDTTLWGFMRTSELDESQFVDSIERRLRYGRFLFLIIGDGIQEGVEALANQLQLHAGLHVSFALVDLSMWDYDSDQLIIIPRIPLRTTLIERGIVTVEPSTGIQILPPKSSPGQLGLGSVRAITASEDEFYAQLDQRRPGMGTKLRAFLRDATEVGVNPEFGNSAFLRWQTPTGFTVSAGYFSKDGKTHFDNVRSSANKFGSAKNAEDYLKSVAAIIGGVVKNSGTDWPNVVTRDGRGVDADQLFDAKEQLIPVLAQFVKETKSKE